MTLTREDVEPMIRGPFVRISPTQIDMEFEHPVEGWLPFTASSTDCEEHGRIAYEIGEENLAAETRT